MLKSNLLKLNLTERKYKEEDASKTHRHKCPRGMRSGLLGSYSILLLYFTMILRLEELLFLLIYLGGKRLQKCGKG